MNTISGLIVFVVLGGAFAIGVLEMIGELFIDPIVFAARRARDEKRNAPTVRDDFSWLQADPDPWAAYKKDCEG